MKYKYHQCYTKYRIQHNILHFVLTITRQFASHSALCMASCLRAGSTWVTWITCKQLNITTLTSRAVGVRLFCRIYIYIYIYIYTHTHIFLSFFFFFFSIFFCFTICFTTCTVRKDPYREHRCGAGQIPSEDQVRISYHSRVLERVNYAYLDM